jgi:hypothetical protein
MPPTSGTARVAGFDVVDQSLEVRRRVGYLPETVPLYPEMSVFEYLTFMGSLRRVPDLEDRVEIARQIAAGQDLFALGRHITFTEERADEALRIGLVNRVWMKASWQTRSSHCHPPGRAAAAGARPHQQSAAGGHQPGALRAAHLRRRDIVCQRGLSGSSAPSFLAGARFRGGMEGYDSGGEKRVYSY